MKILHIIPRFNCTPEGIITGGSLSAMLNLVNASKSDYDSVIYSNMASDQACIDKAKSLPLCLYLDENNAPAGTPYYGAAFAVRSLHAIIKNKAWGADVICGHSGFPFYGMVTALAGKVLRKPSIHALCCPIERNLGTMKNMLAAMTLKYNNKILAMSENVRRSLLHIGVAPDLINFLPPILDTEKFRPGLDTAFLESTFNISPDEPVILFVGNMEHSKGLDLLISALGKLKNMSFKFIMTNELKNSDYNANLRRHMALIEKCGLRDKTSTIGVIDLMPELMARADICVVPYRDTKGPSDYPIALMEAMACGTAAVGTRVGGIPELIEDKASGLLVEPNDEASLSEAVRQLLESPSLRERLGSGARNKIIGSFSYERLKPTIKAIFEQ